MSNSDPYGLNEYLSQSMVEKTSPKRSPDRDIRGNTLFTPRGIPTQAEADALLDAQFGPDALLDAQFGPESDAAKARRFFE